MQDMRLNFFELPEDDRVLLYHKWLLGLEEVEDERIIEEMDIYLQGDVDEVKFLNQILKKEGRKDHFSFYKTYTSSWKNAMVRTFDSLLFYKENELLPITHQTYLYAREQFILWAVRNRDNIYDSYPYFPIEGLEPVQHLEDFQLNLLSDKGEELVLFWEKPCYHLCACHGVLSFGTPSGSSEPFKLLPRVNTLLAYRSLN